MDQYAIRVTTQARPSPAIRIAYLALLLKSIANRRELVDVRAGKAANSR